MLKSLLSFLMPCLILSVYSSASAMTITSDSPGNIFASGVPIKFSVINSQCEVTYEISNYFDKKITTGSGTDIKLQPLEPGWYLLKCKDATEEKSVSFGVVINRGKAALPIDGRICTDVAGAWLVKEKSFESLVNMIRLAGIPRVRERLSWSGTEKERGKIDWNKYQRLADIYAAKGIRICQHWGDSPQWSHPDRKGYVCPDDLRDVYNYAREAASHFSGQIASWEVWNEPDIGFWPELSDRFSGYAKAAYLGGFGSRSIAPAGSHTV